MRQGIDRLIEQMSPELRKAFIGRVAMVLKMDKVERVKHSFSKIENERKRWRDCNNCQLASYEQSEEDWHILVQSCKYFGGEKPCKDWKARPTIVEEEEEEV